jgi:hypothetical protein
MGRRSGAAQSRALIAAGMSLAFASACVPGSHVLTGIARPPTNPADVKVYSTPPPSFQEIAVLDAHHRTLFGDGGERSTRKVVARLKAEAAKVGANGVILDAVEQIETGSFGGGAGSDSYSAHGIVSLSLGAFFGIYTTTGKGRAIVVPPG